MELIGQLMKEYGIAGVLLIVLIAAALFLLRKAFEHRDSDVAWARGELLAARVAYLESLTAVSASYTLGLSEMNKTSEKLADKLCERLDAIEKRITSVLSQRRDGRRDGEREEGKGGQTREV